MKEGEILQEVQILDAKLSVVGREIEDQGKKKERSVQMIKKASRMQRKKEGLSGITIDEQDSMLRTVRDIGNISLKELARVILTYPDLNDRFQSLMIMHNLQPPSRSVSRVSSRASFTGSNSSKS